MTSMPKAVHIYRVGDVVKFKLGAHEVHATVIEDRGFFGRDGQQVVRVALPPDRDDSSDREFEVSASYIEPARKAAS